MSNFHLQFSRPLTKAELTGIDYLLCKIEVSERFLMGVIKKDSFNVCLSENPPAHLPLTGPNADMVKQLFLEEHEQGLRALKDRLEKGFGVTIIPAPMEAK